VKTRCFILLIFALVFYLPVVAADLTGTWTGHITDRGDNNHDITIQLKQDGDKITGTLTGGPPSGAEAPIVDGKIEGDQISFGVKTQGPQGGDIVIAYKGKVTGNQIKGTGEIPGMSLPFEVTKK
jgi:hypothetical protein